MKPVFALSLLLLTAPAVAANPPSKAITTALADPARPADQKARDAARKPAELLIFAGVKSGDKVADFIMGGGYWTRILSGVVGPKGKVYAYQPEEFIKYRAEYATDQDAAVKGYANVVPLRPSLAAFTFAEPLDAIITVQNWHDLHLKQSPPGFGAVVAKKLFDSLKPGGTLLVVDHVGAPGTAETLHRGDPAGTKAEIEGAGFKLAGTSPLYENKADPHTALVFDPAIRGKTDQFIYKFVKPKV
ncbi:methyltransferase [Sphingomonas sp. SUN019]|uniref:class I SAM-dependent methyltransferase n=1 Tax=Sphingomonas sp. SUN019 TaxID=2937788 RepID=UPI0021640E5F|nr:methyltransferase [Sphingomonas sp. SUN019]UVO51716.1 methyltransferase [Sphingomonas sp. SUN019]